MIISASRRTDIPACYPDWMARRVSEGFACVRNPMNPRQVSRVSLSPAVVDCIVFWSKNPAPMLEYLDLFRPWHFYFQYTLNAYGADVERRLPPLERRAETFLRLSDALGPERVVWRYDPILLSGDYPLEFHLEQFSRLADRLRGAAERCSISFLDEYAAIRTGLRQLGARTPGDREKRSLAEGLAAAAGEDFRLVTCAEEIDLSQFGIGRGSCIDAQLIERLAGCPLRTEPDKGQRSACGCAASIDIGAYDTCLNGCRYCYANRSDKALARRSGQYSPASPVLCDAIRADETVSERRMRSLQVRQLGWF